MTTFTTQDRQDAQRTPLTPEQLDDIAQQCWVYPQGEQAIFNQYKFARAIERAHGIGE
jgi:hypothetical protein